MAKNFLSAGGAGFIGSSYAQRLIRRGEKVTILDNLSRKGARYNLVLLEQEFGKENFEFVMGDIRDAELVNKTAQNKDVIVHLAAQVAVTTSVVQPREDFEVNALGTFNVLEAARLGGTQPIVVYASTNKVYGELEDLKIKEEDTRYRLVDFPNGISEERQLDFHSPYGCSKGCGDQYAHDYFRIYQIPTIVFRQSCIYGTRQFGVEDQGWVAWFLIAMMKNKNITIYGNGKQVRDLLFIEDLLDVYDISIESIEKSAGNIYNVGGGPQFSLSVWREFSKFLEDLLGKKIAVEYSDWRPGDQRVYISDIRKISSELGWAPQTSIQQGIINCYQWISENKDLFA